MVFTAHALLVLGSAIVGTGSSEKSVPQSAKLAKDIRIAKALVPWPSSLFGICD